MNLTLFSLELESNYHTVSTVLNKFFKMGFFEFINYLRIEEAKKVHSHSDENHLKVEAVGYECSFNTKSAFYRAFKRFTGLTPNDYHQKVKKGVIKEAGAYCIMSDVFKRWHKYLFKNQKLYFTSEYASNEIAHVCR